MEMAEDINAEEYPTEIHDYLTTFEKSLTSVDEMLKTMMSVSRSELLQKVNHLPLDSLSVDNTGSVWLATAQRNNKYYTSYLSHLIFEASAFVRCPVDVMN